MYRTIVFHCHSATEPPSSVIPGFLRFKARRIGWHPFVISAARQIPPRVLSHHRLTGEGPSVAASGRGAPFDADLSATRVCVDGFRLPAGHHFPAADSFRGYPPGARLAFPRASKHWFALFIEVAADMVPIWNFQGSVFWGATRRKAAHRIFPLSGRGRGRRCRAAPPAAGPSPGLPARTVPGPRWWAV